MSRRRASAAAPRRRSPLRRPWLWALGAAGVLFAAWLAVGAPGLEGGGRRESRPLSAVEARGEAIYQANCASCHGQDGEGEPNWRSPRADGTYRAPPHDSSGHTWHHPDALLIGIVKEGGAYAAPPGYPATMPAWKDRLSDEQIAEVLAYIKTMWGPEEREAQARASQRR